MKKVIVPQAFREIRLAPGRKYCSLGRLASEVGWKHGELVKTLETKRKAKSAVYYQKKKAMLKAVSAAAAKTPAAIKAELATAGY